MSVCDRESRLVFLDVGAHTGETLDVVLEPRLGITNIYAFEPSTQCQRILERYRDSRLTVLPFGLSNRTSRATLHGAGLLGASIYSDKRQLADSSHLEEIQLHRASNWLRTHTTDCDQVLLKLNCEGSECDVLDDLLDHPELLPRLRSVYVDFDIRKIPSQAGREVLVRERLVGAGVPFTTPDDLGRSGLVAVTSWLHGIGVPSARVGPVDRALYRFFRRPPYVIAREVASRLLPEPLYRSLARRFGVNSWQRR